MLEGWKAYALPGVAALLLAAFFAYRCSAKSEDVVHETPKAEPPPAAKSKREQIEAAIADAGEGAPPLPDRYRDAVDKALRPVLDRCRASRSDERTLALAIHIEVAAAEKIGGIVRSIAIKGAGQGEPSASLVSCIDEGARALALPDPAATGIGTYDL